MLQAVETGCANASEIYRRRRDSEEKWGRQRGTLSSATSILSDPRREPILQKRESRQLRLQLFSVSRIVPPRSLRTKLICYCRLNNTRISPEPFSKGSSALPINVPGR